jgi:exportin-7
MYRDQGSVEHCTIGVQLLSVLTSEMNQVSEADANRSLTKHRKIASSFRDQQLFEIFRLCCTLLKSALDSRKTLAFDGDLQVWIFMRFGCTEIRRHFRMGSV